MFKVENLIEIDPSETLLVNELSVRLKGEGQNIIRFGFGEAPFSPPACVQKALQDHAHHTEYLPVQGLDKLRDVATTYHNQRLGTELSADRCYVGPGSKQLMFSVMQSFRDLDVLIPSPAWVSYEPQAHLLGHTVFRIPCTFEGRWRLTPDALNQIMKTTRPGVPKLLIFNYPGNPDGLTYTADELAKLAEALRHHQIMAISDEIYGFLNYENAHQSIATHYPEGTIMTTGLSKWCGAGGWRLGLMWTPSAWDEAMHTTLVGIGSETYSTTAAPVQYAAISAYTSSDEVKQFERVTQSILKTVGSYVATHLSAAGYNVHSPEGGFYVFPDLTQHAERLSQKGIHTNQDLCAAILKETSVAVLPGKAFGMPDNSLTFRLAFVDFDGDAALTAHNQGDFSMETHAPNVVKGAAALSSWLSDMLG